MKRILLLAFLTCQCFSVFAQKYELGKVTVDELNEKRNPKDSSDVAKIIFEKGTTRFQYSKDDGFFMITDVEVKIKIYKKEGYKWANKEVSFYVGGQSKERVEFSKAITYNLEDNKIEKIKLKSEGEFIEKINKSWSSKKITMPNVKEGSIIEYKYSIISSYYSVFPKWFFQNSIPIDHSEYTTSIPQYFTYNAYKNGFLNLKTEIKDVDASITIDTKELGQLVYKHSNETIHYFEKETKYSIDNVPPIKDEYYVNNISNYITSVEHELASKEMPNALPEYYALSWEDVVKKIYDNDDFGNQLNKINYFEEDLKLILTGVSGNPEKINAVYKYVKDRMNWNNVSSYLCDDGVKRAYESKSGNSAEINLMLVAMLRSIGIDSNPVIISTRSNGISLFPSRFAYNFVIASVMLDGNVVLLDATNKFAVPGLLPLSDLNWFGRIVKKDGTSDLIELNPTKTSTENIFLLAEISNEGKISGMTRIQKLDYNAFVFRDKYLAMSSETYLNELEQKYKGIEIEAYEITNDKILEEPIVEKFSVKSDEYIEKIGDKMFFSPMVFFMTSKNPFTQENREYPVEFPFPSKLKYTINIKIPNGYVVETIPESISIKFDEYASFAFTLSSSNSKIQLTTILDINAVIVASQDYVALKDFFDLIIKKQTEKVVLKKI